MCFYRVIKLVRINPSILYDVVITNTEAPQGTFLSPFLFFLTHNGLHNRFIDKYADDTVLTGIFLNGNYSNCMYTEALRSPLMLDWACKKSSINQSSMYTQDVILSFVD